MELRTYDVPELNHEPTSANDIHTEVQHWCLENLKVEGVRFLHFSDSRVLAVECRF